MQAKHILCVFYQQESLVRKLGTSKIHIVGSTSVCFKTVVLLLLLHWLLLLSLFVGVCEWSVLCYALLSVLSFLQSSGQELAALL